MRRRLVRQGADASIRPATPRAATVAARCENDSERAATVRERSVSHAAGRSEARAERRRPGDRFLTGAARCRPAALLIAFAGLLTGCATGGGDFAVRSLGAGEAVLEGRFDTGLYSYRDDNTLAVVLVEGPLEAPSQAVVLRMVWEPRAGRTPMDRRGTNTTVRYVVFAGEDAGVYEGAGFLFPRNNPGPGGFRANLRQASLRLLDRSPGFVDRLGLAGASGQFTAERDDAAVVGLQRRLQQMLRERLGYPRLVTIEPVSRGGGTLPGAGMLPGAGVMQGR